MDGSKCPDADRQKNYGDAGFGSIKPTFVRGLGPMIGIRSKFGKTADRETFII